MTSRRARAAISTMEWMHAMPGRPSGRELSPFTLPIEEPSGGCSLAIVALYTSKLSRRGFDALKYAGRKPPQTLYYARGNMVVHDGLLLHAIGRASIARPVGYRITVQGHGAKFAGSWWLDR